MTRVIESKINQAKEGVLVLKTRWDQNGRRDCNAAFDMINQALDQINTGVPTPATAPPTAQAAQASLG